MTDKVGLRLWRLLRRIGKRTMHRRSAYAADHAWRRARRPRQCLLAQRPELRAFVADKLALEWSPDQTAGHLAKQHPAGAGIRESHETIYKSLFIQSRGVLAKELQKHLRTRGPIRRSTHNAVTGQWRSQIRDAVSISERPAEVVDRAVPGHWEGDLLLGRHWTQIATVVERTTRFTVLVQLDSREMTTLTAGLKKATANCCRSAKTPLAPGRRQPTSPRTGYRCPGTTTARRTVRRLPAGAGTKLTTTCSPTSP